MVSCLVPKIKRGCCYMPEENYSINLKYNNAKNHDMRRNSSFRNYELSNVYSELFSKIGGKNGKNIIPFLCGSSVEKKKKKKKKKKSKLIVPYEKKCNTVPCYDKYICGSVKKGTRKSENKKLKDFDLPKKEDTYDMQNNKCNSNIYVKTPKHYIKYEMNNKKYERDIHEEVNGNVLEGGSRYKNECTIDNDDIKKRRKKKTKKENTSTVYDSYSVESDDEYHMEKMKQEEYINKIKMKFPKNDVLSKGIHAQKVGEGKLLDLSKDKNTTNEEENFEFLINTKIIKEQNKDVNEKSKKSSNDILFRGNIYRIEHINRVSKKGKTSGAKTENKEKINKKKATHCKAGTFDTAQGGDKNNITGEKEIEKKKKKKICEQNYFNIDGKKYTDKYSSSKESSLYEFSLLGEMDINFEFSSTENGKLLPSSNSKNAPVHENKAKDDKDTVGKSIDVGVRDIKQDKDNTYSSRADPKGNNCSHLGNVNYNEIRRRKNLTEVKCTKWGKGQVKNSGTDTEHSCKNGEGPFALSIKKRSEEMIRNALYREKNYEHVNANQMENSEGNNNTFKKNIIKDDNKMNGILIQGEKMDNKNVCVKTRTKKTIQRKKIIPTNEENAEPSSYTHDVCNSSNENESTVTSKLRNNELSGNISRVESADNTNYDKKASNLNLDNLLELIKMRKVEMDCYQKSEQVNQVSVNYMKKQDKINCRDGTKKKDNIYTIRDCNGRLINNDKQNEGSVHIAHIRRIETDYDECRSKYSARMMITHDNKDKIMPMPHYSSNCRTTYHNSSNSEIAGKGENNGSLNDSKEENIKVDIPYEQTSRLGKELHRGKMNKDELCMDRDSTYSEGDEEMNALTLLVNIKSEENEKLKTFLQLQENEISFLREKLQLSCNKTKDKGKNWENTTLYKNLIKAKPSTFLEIILKNNQAEIKNSNPGNYEGALKENEDNKCTTSRSTCDPGIYDIKESGEERKSGEMDKICKSGEMDKICKSGEMDKICKSGEMDKIRKSGEMDKICKSGEMDKICKSGESYESASSRLHCRHDKVIRCRTQDMNIFNENKNDSIDIQLNIGKNQVLNAEKYENIRICSGEDCSWSCYIHDRKDLGTSIIDKKGEKCYMQKIKAASVSPYRHIRKEAIRKSTRPFTVYSKSGSNRGNSRCNISGNDGINFNNKGEIDEPKIHCGNNNTKIKANLNKVSSCFTRRNIQCANCSHVSCFRTCPYNKLKAIDFGEFNSNDSKCIHNKHDNKMSSGRCKSNIISVRCYPKNRKIMTRSRKNCSCSPRKNLSIKKENCTCSRNRSCRNESIFTKLFSYIKKNSLCNEKKYKNCLRRNKSTSSIQLTNNREFLNRSWNRSRSSACFIDIHPTKFQKRSYINICSNRNNLCSKINCTNNRCLNTIGEADANDIPNVQRLHASDKDGNKYVMDKERETKENAKEQVTKNLPTNDGLAKNGVVKNSSIINGRIIKRNCRYLLKNNVHNSHIWSTTIPFEDLNNLKNDEIEYTGNCEARDNSNTLLPNKNGKEIKGYSNLLMGNKKLEAKDNFIKKEEIGSNNMSVKYNNRVINYSLKKCSKDNTTENGNMVIINNDLDNIKRRKKKKVNRKKMLNGKERVKEISKNNKISQKGSTQMDIIQMDTTQMDTARMDTARMDKNKLLIDYSINTCKKESPRDTASQNVEVLYKKNHKQTNKNKKKIYHVCNSMKTNKTCKIFLVAKGNKDKHVENKYTSYLKKGADMFIKNESTTDVECVDKKNEISGKKKNNLSYTDKQNDYAANATTSNSIQTDIIDDYSTCSNEDMYLWKKKENYEKKKKRNLKSQQFKILNLNEQIKNKCFNVHLINSNMHLNSPTKNIVKKIILNCKSINLDKKKKMNKGKKEMDNHDYMSNMSDLPNRQMDEEKKKKKKDNHFWRNQDNKKIGINEKEKVEMIRAKNADNYSTLSNENCYIVNGYNTHEMARGKKNKAINNIICSNNDCIYPDPKICFLKNDNSCIIVEYPNIKYYIKCH
ncbi:hypothetical protein MKS88_005141 [Plasmodium brasilianum]|uniref:Uncharacterized protein n=1 Tax=Plasmodium brasilianum TaxID=5824 RepID=A0ACB9Y612_PLABR|nr:hypothetical protein MKS88_005141 [Plasmodium brasilianum]